MLILGQVIFQHSSGQLSVSQRSVAQWLSGSVASSEGDLMLRRFCAVVIWSLVAGVMPVAAAAQPLVIRGATLIDGNGGAPVDAAVVVLDGGGERPAFLAAVNFALLVGYSTIYDYQAQGRYLFPSYFLMLGVVLEAYSGGASPAPSQRSGWLLVGWLTGIVALNVCASLWLANESVFR